MNRCAECSSPMDAGQRYCVACGARAGAPPRVRYARPARVSHATPTDSGWSGPPFALPSPPVAAAITLALVAFGVFVVPEADDTLAAGSVPIVLVSAPAPGPPAVAPASDSGDTSSRRGSVGGSADRADVVADSGVGVAPAPAAAAPAPAPVATGGGGGTTDTGTSAEGQTTDPATEPAAEPPEHVSVIRLAQASTDLPSVEAYKHRGLWLSGYRPLNDGGLSDVIALLTGQDACTDPTAACVFPTETPTLPWQLVVAGKTWQAQVEDRSDAPTPGDPFPAFAALAANPDIVPLAARKPAATAPATTTTPDATTTTTPAGTTTTPDATTTTTTTPAGATATPAATTPTATTPAPAATTPTATPAPAATTDAQEDTGREPNVTLVFAGLAKLDPAVADPWLVGTIGASTADLIFVELADGMLVIGADVPSGAVDKSSYDTYNLLRAIEDLFELPPLGKAAAADPLPWSTRGSQDVHEQTTGS